VSYRAGLIGCGGVSRDHAKGLHAARNVELVALADVYAPNLHTAGEAYGVDRRYLDYREMLERERLDLVAVCTQAPQHAPIVIAAAQGGVRGVLCEKPIALTLAEADAMLGACTRSGTRLAINHQTRMIPSTAVAERLVQEGAIGELRAARMLDKGNRPAGNSLMELVTHIFDLLRIYAGDPAWVAAHLTVGDPEGRQRPATVADIQYSQTAWPSDRDCGLVLGDRGSVTIGFGPREGWHDGLLATLDSFFQPGRSKATGEVWQPSMELVGTDGVLFLGGTSNHVDLYLHRGPWAPPGKLERIAVPARPIAAGPYAEDGARAPYHTAMVEELVAAIEGGREHRSGGADGRWALEMIMGVYESHRHGGARVALPLPERRHPLQRWLEESGAPLPQHPEAPVRTLPQSTRR
jgi:UDP-N-acetyl-2-amino-2-deoxyglucuronate dehydrogenase